MLFYCYEQLKGNFRVMWWPDPLHLPPASSSLSPVMSTRFLITIEAPRTPVEGRRCDNSPFRAAGRAKAREFGGREGVGATPLTP